MGAPREIMMMSQIVPGPTDSMDNGRPLSYFDDNFVAPLASMEDLSVLMTPMSTPGPTPGPSPKTRARWSHRLSSGAQFDPLPPINDDVILELPPSQNGSLGSVKGDPPFPRRDPNNLLLRRSFSNNRRNLPCPCMTEIGDPIGEKSPFLNGEMKDDFRTSPKILNARKWEEELQPSQFQPRKNHPSWNQRDILEQRQDSPLPQRPNNLYSRFPRREAPNPNPSNSNWKARDVIEPDEKRRILDDSDYPFVRPRQVHFLQSSSPKSPRPGTKTTTSTSVYSNNNNNDSRVSSPTGVSICDGSSSSRVSPKFGSLIRANGGSLEPATMKPPHDRLNLIYLTLVLHGIGSLLAWNMFMTAKEPQSGVKKYMLVEYFVNYKLSKEYTSSDVPYAAYFMQFIGIAAQVPNVVFNWINIFMNIGGTLTSRIVWTLLIEVLVFVATIILAMVDSSDWPGLFFYLTFASVVVLNMANGIYQNTIFGLAAKLPFKYTGAVILGTNLSGTIVALINILSIWLSPNPRTAAIYYFITALFILLACFDTYFALPLNRFYRYHDHIYTRALQEKKKSRIVHALPYWTIFKQCLPQCFNIFFTYFISITIYPAVYADVRLSDEDFFISDSYFTAVTCFLTFNVFSVIGNILPSLCRQPGPRWLFIPVILRLLFLPFFLLCNYRPSGLERLWPTLIYWDSAYWTAGALLGLTGGYFASLAMMHCPRSVEPEYASVAGMFGGASIVSGIVVGLIFSHLMPLLVTHPVFAFEMPEWWPRL